MISSPSLTRMGCRKEDRWNDDELVVPMYLVQKVQPNRRRWDTLPRRQATSIPKPPACCTKSQLSLQPSPTRRRSFPTQHTKQKCQPPSRCAKRTKSSRETHGRARTRPSCPGRISSRSRARSRCGRSASWCSLCVVEYSSSSRDSYSYKLFRLFVPFLFCLFCLPFCSVYLTGRKRWIMLQKREPDAFL